MLEHQLVKFTAIFCIGPAAALSVDGSKPHPRMIAEAAYDKSHRRAVLEGCGEICDENIMGSPGKFFREVRKNVDCAALYGNDQSDSKAKTWPPPRAVPSSLIMDYSMNGHVEIAQDKYYQQGYVPGSTGRDAEEVVWTAQQIQEAVDQAQAGTLNGTYGRQFTKRVRSFLQAHKDGIQGARLFVIGSEQPWLEALLLEAGATHVTTIEYARIRSEDARVTALTPAEVRRTFLDSGGAEPRFDGGASVSSLEHAGLGRYGDTLNPWGDVQAVAKAWCITNDGGPMFVGVPTGLGKDLLHWNAHRIYGEYRWPQLMANWHQVDREIDTASDEWIGVMHAFTKLS